MRCWQVKELNITVARSYYIWNGNPRTKNHFIYIGMITLGPMSDYFSWSAFAIIPLQPPPHHHHPDHRRHPSTQMFAAWGFVTVAMSTPPEHPLQRHPCALWQLLQQMPNHIPFITMTFVHAKYRAIYDSKYNVLWIYVWWVDKCELYRYLHMHL